MSKESVTVEIRVKSKTHSSFGDTEMMCKIGDDIKVLSDTPENYLSRPEPVAPGKTAYTVDAALGKIVGHVIVLTEVSTRVETYWIANA
jgi:hypothetical protein